MNVRSRPVRTVVHVVDNYAPAVGGVERAVAALAAEWQRRDVRPVVVTGRAAGMPAVEQVDGVEVVRIRPTVARIPGVARDPHRVFFPPVADPVAARVMRQVVETHRPDIVHGHGWMLRAVAAGAAGVPIVAGWHDSGVVCPTRTLVEFRRDGTTVPCDGPSPAKCLPCAAVRYGPVRGLAAVAATARSTARPTDAAAVVAISRSLAGHAETTGVGPVTVVPTFIDDRLTVDAAAAPRPGFVPDRPYIGYAGQLGAHKGVGVLLEAHRLLVERGVDVDLVLAGAPTERFTVPAGPRVHVVGVASHTEVLGMFAAAAVVVVPSLYEGFGQTAVEALAAGAPTVVAGAGGLPEVVRDGVDGKVVTAGDVGSLTATLEWLLHDRAAAARFAAAGPVRARQHTLEAVLPRLLAVYDTVLGEPFLPAR